MLEFFEIVALPIYALFAFLTLAVGWFDKSNARLIIPCFVFLAIGLAPTPTWVVILMPFLVAITLLAFRKTTEHKAFDYHEHLLALRDNGTLTQAKYEEESARISGG